MSKTWNLSKTLGGQVLSFRRGADQHVVFLSKTATVQAVPLEPFVVVLDGDVIYYSLDGYVELRRALPKTYTNGRPFETPIRLKRVSPYGNTLHCSFENTDIMLNISEEELWSSSDGWDIEEDQTRLLGEHLVVAGRDGLFIMSLDGTTSMFVENARSWLIVGDWLVVAYLEGGRWKVVKYRQRGSIVTQEEIFSMIEDEEEVIVKAVGALVSVKIKPPHKKFYTKTFDLTTSKETTEKAIALPKENSLRSYLVSSDVVLFSGLLIKDLTCLVAKFFTYP